jgi:hypothetical protein
MITKKSETQNLVTVFKGWFFPLCPELFAIFRTGGEREVEQTSLSCKPGPQ